MSPVLMTPLDKITLYDDVNLVNDYPDFRHLDDQIIPCKFCS